MTTTTLTNKLILSSGKYIFQNNLSNNLLGSLQIGIGTYIFFNIDKDYPIAIDTSNNINIEFIGNTHFLYLNEKDEPITYTINNETLNFYFGTIAIKVSGKFDKIEEYYIYNKLDKSVSLVNQDPNNNSFSITFDNSNTNGSKIENYLEYHLLLENQDENNTFNSILSECNFLLEGNSNNGINIITYNKNSLVNSSTYSYVNSYINFNKSNCLYIGSNGIPNYYSRNDNLIIDGQWFSYFPNVSNSESINYGIDKQSYGYKNSKNLYGYAFKIPINPEYTSVKKIINNQLIEESFWYKNDKNWKELMVDKKYNNVILNNQEIFTPQGNIGVMINGIPITNNLEFSDTITEEIVENGFLFEVNRNLNQAYTNNFYKNQVNISNFDNYGGTVDKNHNYHYNKYPVGLEAMIKLGSQESSFIDSTEVTINENIIFFLNDNSNGIYYLNISNQNFQDYNFELNNGADSAINYNKSNVQFNILGIPGKTYDAKLVIRIYYLESDLRYDLKIYKGSNTPIQKSLYFKKEFTQGDSEANTYYYLDTNGSNLKFYNPKDLVIKSGQTDIVYI